MQWATLNQSVKRTPPKQLGKRATRLFLEFTATALGSLTCIQDKVRFGSVFPRQAHAVRRQTAHSAPPCDGTRHFASLHFTSRWYQSMCSEKPICAPLTQSPGCFPNVAAVPSLCPTLSLCPTRPTNVVRVTVNSTNVFLSR